jgi:hypothetical protein
MPRKYTVFSTVLFAFISTHAAADSVAPAKDFGPQALTQQINQEINTNIQLRAALLAAQDKVNELEAKLQEANKPKEVPKK